MTQQYLFTRKPYFILAILSFLFLVIVGYLSHTSTFDLIYKIAISIYTGCIIIITVEVALRQLVHYIFIKENIMWIKEIDRPRVAITMLSVLFMYLSFDTYAIHKDESFNQILSVIIYIASFCILIICWSEKFKLIILPKIREVVGEPTPIRAETLDADDKHIELVKLKLKEYLSGKPETINKLLKYNTTIDKVEILEEDRLSWICQKGLNNNQSFNSQTLLSFISNLYGTEDSTTLTTLISKLFKNEYQVSSKNISTWRKNKTVYLKKFENDLANLLFDRNIL